MKKEEKKETEKKEEKKEEKKKEEKKEDERKSTVTGIIFTNIPEPQSRKQSHGGHM